MLGLIDSLSEKQIRQFLLQEARSNPSFRLRLELEFLKEVPAELLDTYYSGLDTLLYSHQDASGLIPREGEHQLLEVVNAWLASRIDLLLEHDFDAEAFSLIEYAFMALNDLRFENPQQSAETLLEMLAARLAETAGHKDEALNASIFTWLEMELKNPRLSRSLKHSLLQVLDSAFSSERYIQARLALLEDMLKEETEHRPDSRLDSSLRNQIIRQIFTLFSSTDQYPGEKEAFEKEMENSSLWQDLKIQKAIALDDLETARILLTESLRSVPSGSLEAAVRMRRLATLLKEEGRLPEARAVLKSLMSRNAHLVPADLYMYRDMVDEAEFLSAMHTLHSFVSPLVLGEVYASGGYEEALMDLIEERSDLLLLEQYEERLAARFASRMIALWLEEARTKAASSNSRSYPAAIYALQKAAALPQGEPRAQSMADTLRQSWPHKRSLLHRLEEAGFGEKQDSPVDPQKPEQDKGKETPEKTA